MHSPQIRYSSCSSLKPKEEFLEMPSLRVVSRGLEGAEQCVNKWFVFIREIEGLETLLKNYLPREAVIFLLYSLLTSDTSFGERLARAYI